MTRTPTEPNPGPAIRPTLGAPARTRPPDDANLLRLRFGPRARLTTELFASISSANPDLRLERTAKGELEVMSPAGSEASDRNSEINYQLRHWSKTKGRGLGRAFDSSGGFELPNGAIRSPDASWVARARWEALSAEERKGYAPLCPDFVVELRSETDGLPKLRKKLREYLDQGSRLGWLIDPQGRTVEVYRPGRRVEVLKAPATVSGEDVLPGFVLKLAEVFGD